MQKTKISCSLVAAYLLSMFSSINAAEPQDTPPENWVPFDISPTSFDALLGEVNTNGPMLLSQEFTPYRAQGILEGCGFSYQVLIRDWAYRSNQPTVVYGSVVYFKYPDRVPFLSLRIALRDIEQRDGSLWQKNSAVSYAYLRNELDSLAGSEQMVVDGEEEAKNFVYLDQRIEKFNWLLNGDYLTVGFNRQTGNSDLEFKLPIMSTETWQRLGGCFRELSE